MRSLGSAKNCKKKFFSRINTRPGRSCWLKKMGRMTGAGFPNFPSYNPLTRRHRGKANAAFADGHIENVTSQFGANAANSLPGFQAP
jgi:prepilin-type processing-associated H-X9-DG protein